MSQLLNSLLDPERQRQCIAHAPICFNNQETPPMKHATRPSSRVFADMQASAPVGEVEPFHVTILRHGQPEESYVRHFADSMDAYWDALLQAGEGAVVLVRNFIEQSYFEGKDAFPRLLHPHASLEAQAGWLKAQLAGTRCGGNLISLVAEVNVDRAMWAGVQ